jgi:hypothetical protein
VRTENKENEDSVISVCCRRPDPRVFHISLLAEFCPARHFNSCFPDQEYGGSNKELVSRLRLTGTRQFPICFSHLKGDCFMERHFLEYDLHTSFVLYNTILAVRLKQSPYFLTLMEPRNRFQGMNSASLCSLAGRYDNPIPTRFLAPVGCLKIPAQISISGTEFY